MNEEIDRLKEAEKENFASLAHEVIQEEDGALRPISRPSAPHSYQRKAGGNLIPGIVLIVIGGIFLLSNLTGLSINNWWALFILIPAFSNFQNAWRSYQRHGRLSHSARGSITGGLILTLVAATFLFDFLTWALVWPLFLVILGLSALLGGWFD